MDQWLFATSTFARCGLPDAAHESFPSPCGRIRLRLFFEPLFRRRPTCRGRLPVHHQVTNNQQYYEVYATADGVPRYPGLFFSAESNMI